MLDFDFQGLTEAIKSINTTFQSQAKQSINSILTLRNWVLGFVIQEYELSGSDRAQYGEQLLQKLADYLKQDDVPGVSHRSQQYPQIGQTLSAQSAAPSLAAEILVKSLSFSQFVELLKIDDPLKRCFYEYESIKGNWSIRELKRQIASLYYERTSLSRDPKKMTELLRGELPIQTINDVIRDPYVFEFLDLIKPAEVIYESDVARAILDKLQEFLLELGKGFCFEARNKRILIGDEYYFIDLVLYNRVLKCHVLIELKMQAFNHENIGQLNTYLDYYKKHEMTEGDNPPIGILLCTEKNHALVEFALSDIQNNLFVSKYQLELPSKEILKAFIEAQLKENLP